MKEGNFSTEKQDQTQQVKEKRKFSGQMTHFRWCGNACSSNDSGGACFQVVNKPAASTSGATVVTQSNAVSAVAHALAERKIVTRSESSL